MLESEVNKHKQVKGFIFDGFPRTTAQAIALDNFLASKGQSIKVVLSLEVPEDELKRRLMERAKISGRVDDTDPAVIQRRIDVYKAETAPVKEFYKAQNKCREILGVGSIDEIFERLCKEINS
jgi:adenylate kinase